MRRQDRCHLGPQAGQHDFQVCAAESSEGQQGPRPRPPVLRGVRRTVPNVDEWDWQWD